MQWAFELLYHQDIGVAAQFAADCHRGRDAMDLERVLLI
jgi:hypothetical protein